MCMEVIGGHFYFADLNFESLDWEIFKCRFKPLSKIFSPTHMPEGFTSQGTQLVLIDMDTRIRCKNNPSDI